MNKATKNIFKILFGSILASSLFDPIASRIQGVIGDTISQAREASSGFVKQLIEMMIVACLGFVGIVFMLMGLALFLESRIDVPGTGLAYVGVGILLFTLLTLLVMRYHKK